MSDARQGRAHIREPTSSWSLSRGSRLTLLDVVEINPILDAKNGTAELAVELVGSLMGRQIISLPR